MTGIVNDLTSTFEIVRRLCGDKWKFLIICYLFNGPKRYGELQYHLDSIKPKVLTENLKELEDLGIIQRTSYEGNTLHVEYCLTHLGENFAAYFSRINNVGLKLFSGKKKAITNLKKNPLICGFSHILLYKILSVILSYHADSITSTFRLTNNSASGYIISIIQYNCLSRCDCTYRLFKFTMDSVFTDTGNLTHASAM